MGVRVGIGVRVCVSMGVGLSIAVGLGVGVNVGVGAPVHDGRIMTTAKTIRLNKRILFIHAPFSFPCDKALKRQRQGNN